MTPDAFDTSSRYVQSVDVADGSVVVTYGNGAEMGLQGRTLVHQPYRSADNSVVWRCGWALPPPGLTPIGKGSTAAVTTVEPRYLPSACRP
jgi:hypothetical protein